MKNVVTILFVVFMFFSCQYQQQYKITKVELATGSCFGTCRLTATSIDSKSNYHYYSAPPFPSFMLSDSIKQDHYQGFYSGRITKPFWESLINKLVDIDYTRLDTSYSRTLDDQSLELIVHYDAKIKHIKAQSASLPNNVRDAFNWIAKSHRSVKMEAVKDSFRFETKIQKSLFY